MPTAKKYTKSEIQEIRQRGQSDGTRGVFDPLHIPAYAPHTCACDGWKAYREGHKLGGSVAFGLLDKEGLE